MAQIKLLKVDIDGVPTEMTQTADDITLNSFTIQGANGPVLSTAGLNLNTNPVSGSGSITFTDPTTNTINQTSGALKINNIMRVDGVNSMTSGSQINFPVVTNTATQLGLFRIPQVAGIPSVAPTNAAAGALVYDTADLDLYVWNGTSWHNQDVVNAASAVQDTYTAGAAINARDVVYLSAADNVSGALNTSATTATAVGLAIAAAASAATVTVMKVGRMTGFTALTPAARYYISSTAGTISASVPSASGSSIVQVGYAKNATTLDIQIQQLGRRS